MDGSSDFRFQRIRVLLILDSMTHAGLAPVGLEQIHAFAYFANVLAPVWGSPVFEGSVLRRAAGPYYPGVQDGLDSLVGLGMIAVSRRDPPGNPEYGWLSRIAYRLNHQMARSAIDRANSFEDDSVLLQFLKELALALASLSDEEIASIFVLDATYSDPVTSVDNVVDFDQWKSVNRSAAVAERFASLFPSGVRPTDSETVGLYIEHLQRRAINGR